jgi:adenylate cyclase
VLDVRLPRGLAADLREWLVEFARPGQSRLPGYSLWRVGRLVGTALIVVTNMIGAVAAVVFTAIVVPVPPGASPGHGKLFNAIAAAVYVAVATPAGVLVGTSWLRPLRDWLVQERPATAREQRIVLRAPLRLFVVQACIWFGAAVAFGALNAGNYWPLGAEVAIMVIIAGLITASYSYLLAERLLRSAAARALAQGAPDRLTVPGVAVRAVLAWAMGTGLPVAGLVTIGILELTGSLRATPSRLALTMVAMGGAGITVGLVVVIAAAQATGDPVNSVRRGLARVAAGTLTVRVPVYDGTQVGQLQAGFNQMMAGLAEREQIRKALGTYVDPAVAEYILAGGTSLAGEEIEVTIMFVDVRGFTGFAERASAPVVVASINRLFEQIVPVIHARGGHVDKFVGDGLLAVFGAPRRQPGHADAALAAALEIERAVRDGQLRVGIGLNSGPVVAGNVGGAGRFEFTVIGDAVNVAARAETATRQTGDTILLAQRTRELLQSPPVRLVPRPDVTLKGKAEPVVLYAPLADITAGPASA